MNFSKTTLALAIAALLATPAAFANGSENGHDNGNGHSNDDGDSSSRITATMDNEVDVSIEKDLEYSVGVEIWGGGEIPVRSSATALIDDKQLNGGNFGVNAIHGNDASVDGAAGQGASGNIGVNVTAGDNNQQDNAAAVAAADAYFVFGAADAEVIVAQDNGDNVTLNSGTTNSSNLSGDSFQGASGNLGINISAGNNNQQKNNLAVASAPSRLSIANTATIQRSGGNASANAGRVDVVQEQVQVTMSGTMSGTYEGQSDQIGDVYPDIWTVNPEEPAHDQHPNSPEQTGHFDLDTQTQGGTDLNEDGGALAFNEAGDVTLEGSLSGVVTVNHLIYTPSQNSAHMGDNALAGASGNIGVNIASGSGNQQNNSLAVSNSVGTTPLPDMGGEVPGGEL